MAKVVHIASASEPEKEVVEMEYPMDPDQKSKSVRQVTPFVEKVVEVMNRRNLGDRPVFRFRFVYEELVTNIGEHCMQCDLGCRAEITDDQAHVQLTWKQEQDFDFVGKAGEREDVVGKVKVEMTPDQYGDWLCASIDAKKKAGQELGGAGFGLFFTKKFADGFDKRYDSKTKTMNVSFSIKKKEGDA